MLSFFHFSIIIFISVVYLSSSSDSEEDIFPIPPSPLQINENPANNNVVVNDVNDNNVQEAGTTVNNIQPVNQVVGNGVEDTDYDTATTVSYGQFVRVEQNEEVMNERKRHLDERERLLKEREAASITQMATVKANAEELKRKIDEFLENDANASLLIDPLIYGYAFSAHPFLFMTKTDQVRLSKLRIKVAEIQERIDAQRHQIHVNARQPNAFADPTCVVCFDDIRSPNKRFSTLRCGHIYCEECMGQINRCGVCRMEFDNDNENHHIRLNLSFNQINF